MLQEALDPRQTADDALVAAVVVVSTLAITPLLVHAARRMFPGRTVFFARWGFTHVLLVAIAFFVGGILAGVLGAVGLFDPNQETGDVLDAFLPGAITQGAAVVAVLAIAHRRDPRGIRCLGFQEGGNLRAFVLGISTYMVCAMGILALTQVWPWILERIGQDFEPQPFGELFLRTDGVRLAFAFVLGGLVLPLFEEIVFRGFLQPLLVQNFRDVGGVVLTSLLFAGIHGVGAFLPIFGLSLLLGAVMLRTQRIAAPWAVHAAHNSLNILFLLLGAEAGAAG